MEWKLTKQQAEVADWAVGAAPEEDPDFMRDMNVDDETGVPLPVADRLLYEDAPKLDGLILTMSAAWIPDFTDRVTSFWADVCAGAGWSDAMDMTNNDYGHAAKIVNGWIRAGQNLGEKVNA